jgi:general secretion pathway protein D
LALIVSSTLLTSVAADAHPAETSEGDPGAAAAPADTPRDKAFNSCEKPAGRKRMVNLALKPDTNLGDLISWISSVTCKQFLLPGTIPSDSRKVTLVAPEPITPEEAYRLFLGALDSVGLTVQPSGKVLRIIETAKAKTSPIPIYGADPYVPMTESYVTRLIHVENADPNDVAAVFLHLKGEQGDVIVYAPGNALIVTDLASNITRMMNVLKEIDQPRARERVWMIAVKNLSAADMAQKLGEVFQPAEPGGKQGGAAPVGDPDREAAISKIIPIDRSNQLILIADERGYDRARALVKKLDVTIGDRQDRVHIYACTNADCDELAQTLLAVTGLASMNGGGGPSRSRGSPGNNQPAASAGSSGPIAGLLFEGEVRVTFDRPTNALVIVSSLRDYQEVRRLIKQLDSPRKQVFIEAMILEVTMDRQLDLGASFHWAKPENLFGLSDPSLLLGGLNPSNTLYPTNALSDTMLAGILGPVLTSAQAQSLGVSSTVDVPSFGVLIKALQTNGDVDVLSNPHLLIMNNEEGDISVGQRVPFPVTTAGLSGSTAASGSSALSALGGSSPQVQRQKVALEMKLTPHVNGHDLIRLEVDEKIEELGATSGNLGPSTSERTAKTTILAKDQQTVLIGGLMSDKVIKSVTKIPVLGDIPILGFFFRNSTRHAVKTDLIIALTAYVISDQADLRKVIEKKMNERREFIERFGGEERSLAANIDYRRKRGMLEEINRAAEELENDEKEMHVLEAKEQAQELSGPLDLSGGPASGSPDIPASVGSQ